MIEEETDLEKFLRRGTQITLYLREWSYLMVVLKAFGFHRRFIDLVNQCINKVQFTILLNGGKTEDFNPTRGLRQGIPLSPYLF